MLSYSSYILLGLAALSVTCHAVSNYPGVFGIPGNPAVDGPRGPPGFLAAQLYNAVSNLQHQLLQLEAVLALNGKIRKVGNKIFASNGKKADFASALRTCEEFGGTLATPMNEEENKAIMDFAKQYNQYVFLGIREGDTPGQFKYINGMPLTYSNWYQHQPDGKGKEKCVEMYTVGTWNDRNCKVQRLTVCEF
ncbi:pulmonary surfactant-associated protein A-like [Oenanthe melanoleuca]|uniref:pulmonary surfactant-associated protein A-like n=1 Tax=Oenanthe melanoleuca TaxID=2939378 RepID=UPI0024C20195|nr:pulmonary surfactant-associated protein A-like [Oenanthe melanoleuca]